MLVMCDCRPQRYLNRPIRASVVFNIVILVGSVHNFNFSVNSRILVKVACLKTFEKVMKNKNNVAVVDEYGRELKILQNKTSSKNGERGLKRRSERKMGADAILKVFRYSFSETIPIFFNRLKMDFILVRSLQNFRQ